MLGIVSVVQMSLEIKFEWVMAIVLVLSFVFPCFSTAHSQSVEEVFKLPEITKESRPWTYWWWLGSAVTKEEITRHMQLFKQSGLGGVHIIPIYGAHGYESRYITYLSDHWLEMLAHTINEGQRLNLGVDMTLGTGWNMGGPWIDENFAARRLLVRTFTLKQGERLKESLYPDQPYAVLQALMAFSQGGQVLDLTDRVDLKTKQLGWSPESGDWKLYAAFQILHGMKVKRAAPGGEGFVIDFFSRRAIERFLEPFNEALSKLKLMTDAKLRAVYHDSFEVIGENWTDDFFAQFQRRRGYDLRFYLPALVGDAEPELVTRVRSDFRQTVDELILEESVRPWVEWSHHHGLLVRYEAHGSPGNLLDLYAAADIPESETFGPDWLSLAGLKPLEGTPTQRGQVDPKTLFLINKFASSAANVTGKKLCSNETATWLGEHFRVPLEHVKVLTDLLFLAGINHIFYHGIPFSPSDAEWPGWLFYASTHFGPTNTFWHHFPALNEYIARCQAFLQSSEPDNDLLVYFPIFDLWAKDEGTRNYLHFLTVHSQWLEVNLTEFTQTSKRLWERGYAFDFVSDRMLKEIVGAENGSLKTLGGEYKALLLSGCTLMQPETLRRIVELIEKGATVLVLGDLPEDVPGLANLSERRKEFASLREKLLGSLKNLSNNFKEAKIGQGKLIIGNEIEALMDAAGIVREEMVDSGLKFLRRKEADDRFVYFLVNLSGQRFEGWLPISKPAKSVVLFDPMNCQVGLASVRHSSGRTEVFLQLEPRQSLILRTLSRKVEGQNWLYWKLAGEPIELSGEWQVEFVDGGPSLPKPTTVSQLKSWTEWTHDDPELLKAFSGLVRYRLKFGAPKENAEAWLIDLGQVCYSAKVWLNGKLLGTLISSPFRVFVPKEILREKDNELVVEVANLMANRIAYMDKKGIHWQKFFFVNIHYQPFSAVDWEPLPSGLLGLVKVYGLEFYDALCSNI
ncbi:MAG: glycosyl hydrolase [Armatimonadetes bacterium]|nr:glycosyl hydrolase [Armatimonadota bacterium]